MEQVESLITPKTKVRSKWAVGAQTVALCVRDTAACALRHNNLSPDARSPSLPPLSNPQFLIYNNYHNPTGAASSPEEMERLAQLAVEHDWQVLSDEAYWDLVFDEAGPRRSIVSLEGMHERTTILHTFSKSWSMTGWRLGAAVG